MPTPRRLAALLAGLVLSPVALCAAPEWSPPLLLDTRQALEVAPIRQDPTDAAVYLPVLFEMPANPSLEIAVVDTSVHPPGYSSHVMATGPVFALGAAHQVGDRIGFSYVDTFFDGRFGTCQVPCQFPANHSVSIGTYIDSASAASADDYFVALVDNAVNHGILTRYSTNGGTSWQTLHTTLPAAPGGVYPAFEGGKRLQLVVDPNATDPATTRNCLLYEVRPTAGTTALRLNCRNGATAAQGGGAFNVVLDTDVPNPSGTFDKFIQTSCLIVEGGSGDDVVCAYSHRQTQETRVVRVDESGQLTGPETIVSTASSTVDYGISVAGGEGDDEVRILHPVGSVRVADATSTPNAGSFVAPGPPGEYGSVSASEEDGDHEYPPIEILPLFYLFMHGAVPQEAGRGGNTGLYVSHQIVPLFADGFDTGNRLRWSGSNP